MIAQRTKNITPFMVMEIMERAHKLEQQGISVVHLEVGEPDFETPECIKRAAHNALDKGLTHYTHSLGLLELREAICEHYFNLYNVSVSPDRIIITSGTSPAMLIMFSALIEKGDQVILPDPHYSCYPNFIKFMQGTPVYASVYEQDGFQYRPESIKKKITDKTRAVFINSPSNPTGNILSKDRMQKIADLASEKSLHIISDEIYHGLVYEGTAHCILEFTDNAFVFNGFSKLYAMTGLRLGYLLAPEEFIRPMQIIAQNFFISANSMVQHAGIAALKESGDDITRMKHVYNERRKYMIRRLKDLGFGITVEPTGAFYVFVNAKHINKNSYELAFDILEKAHLGVTPGIDFGKKGEGYLRFSYASSMDNIKEGMDRLENYIKNL